MLKIYGQSSECYNNLGVVIPDLCAVIYDQSSENYIQFVF